jgi:hypothetical protein
MAVKVYKFKLNQFDKKVDTHNIDPVYALAFRVLLDGHHTYRSLKRRGFTDRYINSLIEGGMLIECDVGWKTRHSLEYKDRYIDDPAFRKRLEDAAEKSRTSPNKPSAKVLARALKRARFVRNKPIRARRNKLLREVILPNFGVKRGDTYEPPESVPVAELVDILEGGYQDVLDESYTSAVVSSPARLRQAVYLDVIALGIRPCNMGETADYISMKLKKRAETDEEYRNALMARAARATSERIKMFRVNPDARKAGDAKSAKTRREMMQTDSAFSRTTRANLSLGNSALWDKAESDPEFRERMYKRMRRGHDKGRETIMRRADRRCYNLFKQVIIPEFGWPSPRTGVKEVLDALDEYPDFVERYYGGLVSDTLLKKDLHRMRTQIDLL